MKKIFKLLILVIACFAFDVYIYAIQPQSCDYKFKIGNSGVECSFNFYNDEDLNVTFTCAGGNVSKFEINTYICIRKQTEYDYGKYKRVIKTAESTKDNTRSQ